MGVAEPVMVGGKDTRMKSEEEKPLLRVTAKGRLQVFDFLSANMDV
jgi:GTP:adenosylcobinamide-phosphate guanylyltransferase